MSVELSLSAAEHQRKLDNLPPLSFLHDFSAASRQAWSLQVPGSPLQSVWTGKFTAKIRDGRQAAIQRLAKVCRILRVERKTGLLVEPTWK